MAVYVLGVSTSPRAGSNSDVLLRKALTGAGEAGAQTEYLRLADYKVGPCMECNSCYATGRCVLNDDYPQILQKILDTDHLIIASPIFYMSVCAQAKMLIDRAQCLWAKKNIIGRDIFFQPRDRRAMVIAVGGSKSIKQFESVRLTMKTYFDSLQFRYRAGLYVNNVDTAGAVEKNPKALQEAFRLGKLLATANAPLPAKPVEIELT